MVLHSYVNYTGAPINYSGSPQYDLLRSIESGASLYYILCFGNTSHMKDDKDLNKYYGVDYQNWYGDILVNYKALNDQIGGLQSYEIVDHKTLLCERVIDGNEEKINFVRLQDEIIEINGRRMFTTNDIMYAFTAVTPDENGITTLDMTVVRDGKKVPLNVQFDSETEDGISYIVLDFSFIGEEKNFFNVISATFKTTFSYCRTVWFSLVDLIGGKFGISAVSGPVGVTTTIGQAAKMGLMNILPIMALITVNLGIFNLLPVPALDGGRLLFIFFEMITRRKLAKKYEGVIHAVGLILLLLLMLLVTFKDIWQLIAR
jgi:RIP metalloprotease RseP